MKTNLKTLLADAQAEVNSYTVEEAKTKLGNPDYVFVDVREKAELENEGSIPGAVHIPRGMLEFCLEPSSPYYNPVFESGKNFIFYCKSGGRSVLSAQRAIEMGLPKVTHMEGGYLAWKDHFTKASVASAQ